MLSSGEAPPPFKDGELVSGQAGFIYPYNHADSMAQKAFLDKWMWPCMCCVGVGPCLLAALCAVPTKVKSMKSKKGDEEEPEEEEEEE
jgi:hypothetical protein